jgi:hypothetical protein
MLSHTAAYVQYFLSVKIRKHAKQNRRLDAIIKIHVIAPAALKVFKEIIVIIDILL